MPEKAKSRADRNRENSLASTGPKSLAGKRKASQNNLRHGLRSRHTVIPGESEEEFEAFQEDVARDLNATSSTERALSQLVASNMWRLARGARYEAQSITGSLTRQELVTRYEEHLRHKPIELMIKGRFPTQSSLETRRDMLDGTVEEITIHEEISHLIKNIETVDAGIAIPRDILKRIARLAETDRTIVRDILKTTPKPSVEEVITLLKYGAIGTDDILEKIKRNIEAWKTENAKRKRAYERELREYEAGLAAFSARFMIPEKDDLERLQAYETHTHKSLQKTLEAFRQIREIQALGAAPIEVSVVASNAEKRVGKKSE